MAPKGLASMQDRPYREIPLHGRGGVIRAYVKVDAADYVWAAQYRWQLHPGGYAVRCFGGRKAKRRAFMHRELLGLIRGDRKHVDHINRDKLDNRRANLRLVRGQSDNGQNQPSMNHGTSRHRNVSWDRRRRCWVVEARVQRRRYMLGTFSDEGEAARVAAAWRAENMPYSPEALDAASQQRRTR